MDPDTSEIVPKKIDTNLEESSKEALRLMTPLNMKLLPNLFKFVQI